MTNYIYIDDVLHYFTKVNVNRPPNHVPGTWVITAYKTGNHGRVYGPLTKIENGVVVKLFYNNEPQQGCAVVTAVNLEKITGAPEYTTVIFRGRGPLLPLR